MWGEQVGPVGTALAPAPAPPLPPHQHCLVDSCSSRSDGYNMLLTAVQLPSTCSPPDHLDDLRGREMRESPAQNLNDSDYFWQGPNSPLPFFLSISHTRGPPVGSGLSLPLWTISTCSLYLQLHGRTCHQRYGYCRLIPHSPAYSVMFSPSSLTGCSGKKGLWSQTNLGFIPIIALLSI